MSATISNRELLEMAAKAVGLKPDAGGLNGGAQGAAFSIPGDMVLDWHNGKTWNPGDNDGDCARMEARLGMNLTWYSGGVLAAAGDEARGENFRDHGGDRNAARRAASLQAAYAIGKAMP